MCFRKMSISCLRRLTGLPTTEILKQGLAPYERIAGTESGPIPYRVFSDKKDVCNGAIRSSRWAMPTLPGCLHGARGG